MEADRSTLVPRHRGRPPAVVARSSRAASAVEIRLDVGEGIAGWVAQTREIVNIPEAYADQRFQPAVDVKSGYRTRSILSVPMLGALGGLVGVLQVLNKAGRAVHDRRRGAAVRAREPGRDRDRERAALSLARHAEPGAARRAARPRAAAARAQRAVRGREGAVGGARPRRPAVAHPRAGDHGARRRRRLDRARRVRRRAAVSHRAGPGGAAADRAHAAARHRPARLVDRAPDAADRRRSGARSAPRGGDRAGDRRDARSTSWSRRSSTART